MTINETTIKLLQKIQELEDKILDLQSVHGEIHGWHFTTSFPTSPYPNQIIVKTNESPPDGGVMYRWDATSSRWRRLN